MAVCPQALPGSTVGEFQEGDLVGLEGWVRRLRKDESRLMPSSLAEAVVQVAAWTYGWNTDRTGWRKSEKMGLRDL